MKKTFFVSMMLLVGIFMVACNCTDCEKNEVKEECITCPEEECITCPEEECITCPEEECITCPEEECITCPEEECFDTEYSENISEIISAINEESINKTDNQ